MKIHQLIIFLITVPILGCSTLPPYIQRANFAQDIAQKSSFTKEYIKAGGFMLMTYQRFGGHSDDLRIYIEGDGRAWRTKFRLSDDPTPLDPIALKLAALDPSDNVVYIARPGQYPLSGVPDCSPRYWSESRFSLQVIRSFNQAIDMLKEKSKTTHVELIGYSGGGAIAVLMAARRQDVVSLRTVAGNLDTKAFCQYHHVSPLEDSLNPMDDAYMISNIPQRHFVGLRDNIVPGFIARHFVDQQEGDKGHYRVTTVLGATHSKGWVERWRELLSLPV